jgi:hypothetical protein
MLKSHIRDYATAAFRFYADTRNKLNKPAIVSVKYKDDIWDREILAQHKLEGRGGISDPSPAAVVRAEQALEMAVAEVRDLESVERTIKYIEGFTGGHAMMEALQMVYMAAPHREPERGEISARVHKAELEIPASEPTIYRWLHMARRAFAEDRGLRL